MHRGDLARRIPLFVIPALCGLGAIWAGFTLRNDPDGNAPLFYVFGIALTAVSLVQIFRLTRLRLKLPEVSPPSVAVDAKGVLYLKVRIKWSEIEDVLVCDALRKRCVGIRTVNNEAVGQFIQRTNFPKMPLDGRISFDRARRKTGCAIIILPVAETTPEELRDLILSYRAHYLTQPEPIAQ